MSDDEQRFPPAVPEPCNDCPWRRDATPEWLGPYTALDWIKIAHSEQAIACHQTIVTEPGEQRGNWSHPRLRQCRGAAIFRANVIKQPKHPDIETGPRGGGNVFESNDEFLEHHGEPPLDSPIDLYGPLSTGDTEP